MLQFYGEDSSLDVVDAGVATKVIEDVFFRGTIVAESLDGLGEIFIIKSFLQLSKSYVMPHTHHADNHIKLEDFWQPQSCGFLNLEVSTTAIQTTIYFISLEKLRLSHPKLHVFCKIQTPRTSFQMHSMVRKSNNLCKGLTVNMLIPH